MANEGETELPKHDPKLVHSILLLAQRTTAELALVLQNDFLRVVRSLRQPNPDATGVDPVIYVNYITKPKGEGFHIDDFPRLILWADIGLSG
jgi:hypothetical protein